MLVSFHSVWFGAVSLLVGCALSGTDLAAAAAPRKEPPAMSSESKPQEPAKSNTEKPLPKTDAEWRKLLTPEQYRVTRQKGTERPFSGQYEHCWKPGVYRCLCCGAPLFASESKFDAGCGWPSFTRPAEDANIKQLADNSHGMRRIEVQCKNCGAHLGHVFDDGPGPTGKRYCINSVSLKLDEKKPQPGQQPSPKTP
jgi:peptide-methionine (R)-S-oxide reductase